MGVVASIDGTGRTLTITGDLTALTDWLASSGLTFSPDADNLYFSGDVPLNAELRNDTLASARHGVGTASSNIRVTPVASQLLPTTTNAATDEETAVPLAISVPATLDDSGNGGGSDSGCADRWPN